jgi:hypothetical protein
MSKVLRAGGAAVLVEHLPRKHEVLSSNPTTEKKKSTWAHEIKTQDVNGQLYQNIELYTVEELPL